VVLSALNEELHTRPRIDNLRANLPTRKWSRTLLWIKEVTARNARCRSDELKSKDLNVFGFATRRGKDVRRKD